MIRYDDVMIVQHTNSANLSIKCCNICVLLLHVTGTTHTVVGLVNISVSMLDPQAGAVSRIRRRIFVRRKSAEKNSASRIRRQIFVRRKSAEKVWLAEYYYRRRIPLHYYCISMLDSGERLN